MTTKFDNDIKRGNLGESIAFVELCKHHYVTDVRSDKLHMDADVDYIAISKRTNRLYFVEVKTDYMIHKTGNVPYEKLTSGNTGCFEKTEADIIMYIDVYSKVIYYMWVKKLREYVHYNEDYWVLQPMGDAAKGYLIKIDELIRAGIVFRTQRLESTDDKP